MKKIIVTIAALLALAVPSIAQANLSPAAARHFLQGPKYSQALRTELLEDGALKRIRVDRCHGIGDAALCNVRPFFVDGGVYCVIEVLVLPHPMRWRELDAYCSTGEIL